jgi:hypothetical protein
MPRTKERPKLIHEATTLEYLFCLENMPKWSQVLSDYNNGKPYNDFLKWIIQQRYFKDDQKISIKKIAELSGYASAKISKWLREIYDDLLELNEAQPSLFYFPGNIEVELYFHYYDSHCSFKTSLPVVPRKYEMFEFHFIKAKLGVHFFWVDEVRHIIEENRTYISISLQGGFVNIYRELALSKALFEGTVSSLDVYKKYAFEIDKELGRNNLF